MGVPSWQGVIPFRVLHLYILGYSLGKVNGSCRVPYGASMSFTIDSLRAFYSRSVEGVRDSKSSHACMYRIETFVCGMWSCVFDRLRTVPCENCLRTTRSVRYKLVLGHGGPTRHPKPTKYNGMKISGMDYHQDREEKNSPFIHHTLNVKPETIHVYNYYTTGMLVHLKILESNIWNSNFF